MNEYDYGDVVSRAAAAFGAARGQTLSVGDFEISPNSQGKQSQVLVLQADVPIGLRQDKSVRFSLPAFESFTTNGTAGDNEQFGLTYDLIDSDQTSVSVAAYIDDGVSVSRTDIVSRDIDADTITVSDSGTNNDLYVFYTAGDQATFELRKTAPKNFYRTLRQQDIGLLHRRDADRDPVQFDFNDPLGGVVPINYELEVYVDAPYQVRFEYTEGSEPVRAPNGLVALPVRRADSGIEGLSWAVKQEIVG